MKHKVASVNDASTPCKTEFLIIGSRLQMLKINDCTIRVGTTDIAPVSEVRNLGSWLDCNFSMSTHISKSCSAAFFSGYTILSK